uniref:(northern house mosquito) hypothetical protein n=1 Tax=Culex pipiens TaxID=7175 RepID=A0A8D8ILR9_CULPI
MANSSNATQIQLNRSIPRRSSSRSEDLRVEAATSTGVTLADLYAKRYDYSSWESQVEHLLPTSSPAEYDDIGVNVAKRLEEFSGERGHGKGTPPYKILT